MAEQQISDGNTDGTVYGQSGDKVAFYNGTPVVKRSGSTQSALTLVTATTTGFGFSTSAGFTAAMDQLEEIRAALVGMGLLTGS
jgi:hypothetical protein